MIVMFGSLVAPGEVILHEGLKTCLVERVRGVGDQLAEEDFAVRVQPARDELEDGAYLGAEFVLFGGGGGQDGLPGTDPTARDHKGTVGQVKRRVGCGHPSAGA